MNTPTPSRLRRGTAHLAPPPNQPNSTSNHPNSPYTPHLSPNDPRTSSTQSLHPATTPPLTPTGSTAHLRPHSGDLGSTQGAAAHPRRKLLLIYVHGFMGNETSFHSFPAHVHNLLTILLAGSHAVHTKIYPRYKSRRTLPDVARELGAWLAPHQGCDGDADADADAAADVVLLGHSMGGLVAAEVVLRLRDDGGFAGGRAAGSADSPFAHRVLGTVNFDVPFLGLHPGVISSGIASLFQGGGDETPPAPPAGASTSSSSSTTSLPQRHDTLFDTPAHDPRFNPRYGNDAAPRVERKGWRGAAHFMTKHSDALRTAMKGYVKSHVEFGGAVADWRGLRNRYNKIRGLEEEQPMKRADAMGVKDGDASPPRVRFVNYYTACHGRPKKAVVSPTGNGRGDIGGATCEPSQSNVSTGSGTPSPRISIEEHRQAGECLPGDVIDSPAPNTIPTSDPPGMQDVDAVDLANASMSTLSLAPSSETTNDTRESFSTGQLSLQSLTPKTSQSSAATDSLLPSSPKAPHSLLEPSSGAGEGKTSKPKRDRKFCILPPKDGNGVRDPTWVRVFMEGVDEVGAHCGLFVLSNRSYDHLVGDVADRIEEWVREAESERVVREIAGGG